MGRARWHKKAESLWLAPLLPPFRICWVCLEIKKKMSCKDEVKTDYSREHILLYVVHRDKPHYFSLHLILVPFSVPFVTHTWVFPGPENSVQDGWTIGALRSICRLILPSSGTRSAKTFAISMEISDMHECLTSLPRRLMPPLQHLHLQKGCWWLSASSAPPKHCLIPWKI